MIPYLTLDQLSSPPPGKSGWPWTKDSPPLPDQMPDGSPWPRVTIVTPSYNQGQFIEETIRSVLLQGYPNLEYLIMDGGSTDGSREIIEYYAPYLAYWRSEKDDGQSAAISEGFAMATGEILGWLNSDDLLLPGCLQKVAAYFVEHSQTDCVVGGGINIDAFGKVMRDRMGLPKITLGGAETFNRLLIRNGLNFMQPASFWRYKAYCTVGGLNPALVFAMDYDLYLRLAKQKPFGHINSLLACFRRHGESKTTKLQATRFRESDEIRKQHGLENLWGGYRKTFRIYLSVTDRIENLGYRLAVASGRKKLDFGGYL